MQFLIYFVIFINVCRSTERLFSEMKETDIDSIDGLQSVGFESPEVKKRKEFKYYNNSLIFVSFKAKALQI